MKAADIKPGMVLDGWTVRDVHTAMAARPHDESPIIGAVLLTLEVAVLFGIATMFWWAVGNGALP